jgi:hypothetical protein
LNASETEISEEDATADGILESKKNVGPAWCFFIV